MNVSEHDADIPTLLKAVASDRLDTLSPEQVARLEAELNADAELASRLAPRSPTVEPSLRTGVESPPPDAWQRVWQRIEAATASPRPIASLRTLRLWRPLMAAAAAGVLMVGVWSASRHAQSQPWPVEWAHDVEINALEVPDGRTPLVLAGGADAVPVIWVFESGG